MRILEEIGAEGGLAWLPPGLRGRERERALEAWLIYFAATSGSGARPLDLFKMAEREVRQNHARGAPRVRRTANVDLAVRRALEAAREAAASPEDGGGSILGAVIERVGGFVIMQFLSGFRTYIGAAILMLTGAAAVLNALACILQGVSDATPSAVADCWQSVLVGAGTFGAGMAALGLGGKVEKATAAQIAVAEGKADVAKAIAAGDIPPKAVTR